MQIRIVQFAFATLGLAAAAGCAPELPPNPTYAADVKPIMLSHCVRCHGAGGNLNPDPKSTLNGTTKGPPTNGYFDHLEDQGDCTTNTLAPPTGSCKLGLNSYATNGKLVLYVHAPQSMITGMPPAPAPSLNKWEMDVVDRWAANPLP